jgi:zinc protease
MNIKNLFIAGFFFFISFSGWSYAQEELPLINYPEFTDITLENGLRVLVSEHHEQLAVFFRMLVKIGSRDEKIGKEGLIELMAGLLNKGTIARTSEEISEIIDGIGGRLWVSPNTEYTVISSDVLSEDLETGLDLFADVILNPVFPKKESKRVKKEIIAGIKSSYSDPFTIASRHAAFLMFGPDNRLGREITEKGIKKLKIEDVRIFYEKYTLPNNSILLVIGDFSTSEILQKIKEKFLNWERGKPNNRKQITSKEISGIKFRFVHKPDLTQSIITINEWGIKSKSEDEPAYRIMNYILGGGSFSSRLMTVVRSEGGKTYGINSRYETHPDYGTFRIRTFTRNQEVAKTYNTVLNELDKFINEGITEKELDKAKSFYLGNIPLQLESPGSIANRVLNGLYNGFALEDLRRELIELNKVTLEDVNKAAKKYLDSRNFVLVIVGDGKEIRSYLSDIGEFEEVKYRDQIVRN